MYVNWRYRFFFGTTPINYKANQEVMYSVTLLIIVAYIINIILTNLAVFLDVLTCRDYGKRFIDYLNTFLLKLILPKMDIQITNKEMYNRANTIYVSNHMGYYDGIILQSILPEVKFIAKNIKLTKNVLLQDFFNIEAMYYLLGNGRFPGEPNKTVIVLPYEKGYQSMLSCIIDSWPMNLWIFPSGSLETPEFRSGAFRIAKQLGWNICPVRLSGFPEYKKCGVVFPNNIDKISVEFGRPRKIKDVEVDCKEVEEWVGSNRN
jgi:1-acyl-sn-glycerol-3-phosphate acyltransferase